LIWKRLKTNHLKESFVSCNEDEWEYQEEEEGLLAKCKTISGSVIALAVLWKGVWVCTESVSIAFFVITFGCA